eukprot:SAG31_NODE_7_length_42755_cov_130.245728_33_plen_31_part_00
MSSGDEDWETDPDYVSDKSDSKSARQVIET